MIVARLAVWLFISVALASQTGCGSTTSRDELRDRNRPATFGDSCGPDGGTCEGPFTCMPGDASTTAECTQACASDDDCPHWTATGHCEGPTYGRCQEGLCKRPQCK